MSQQLFGNTDVIFGIDNDESWGYMESLERSRSVNVSKAKDGLGSTKAVAHTYAEEVSVTGTAILLDVDTSPFTKVGDATPTITLTDTEFNALGTLHVEEATETKGGGENGDFMKVNFSGTVYENLGTPAV